MFHNSALSYLLSFMAPPLFFFSPLTQSMQTYTFPCFIIPFKCIVLSQAFKTQWWNHKVETHKEQQALFAPNWNWEVGGEHLHSAAGIVASYLCILVSVQTRFHLTETIITSWLQKITPDIKWSQCKKPSGWQEQREEKAQEMRRDVKVMAHEEEERRSWHFD